MCCYMVYLRVKYLSNSTTERSLVGLSLDTIENRLHVLGTL